MKSFIHRTPRHRITVIVICSLFSMLSSCVYDTYGYSETTYGSPRPYYSGGYNRHHASPHVHSSYYAPTYSRHATHRDYRHNRDSHRSHYASQRNRYDNHRSHGVTDRSSYNNHQSHRDTNRRDYRSGSSHRAPSIAPAPSQPRQQSEPKWTPNNRLNTPSRSVFISERKENQHTNTDSRSHSRGDRNRDDGDRSRRGSFQNR